MILSYFVKLILSVRGEWEGTFKFKKDELCVLIDCRYALFSKVTMPLYIKFGLQYKNIFRNLLHTLM